MSIVHGMRLIESPMSIGGSVSTGHARGIAQKIGGDTAPRFALIGEGTGEGVRQPNSLIVKGGRNQAGERCDITTGKRTQQARVQRRTTRSRIRPSSSVSLRTIYVPYSLEIMGGGKITFDATRTRIVQFPLRSVDILIHNVNGGVSRFPLDVQIAWDARSQRLLVNNQALTSAKVSCRENRCHLDYDQRELARLVGVHSKALFYMVDNNDRLNDFTKMAEGIRILGGELQRLKLAGASFARDAKLLRYRDLLKNVYKELTAIERQVLDGQSREIRTWKRNWGKYTPLFRSRIIFVGDQIVKLKARIRGLKAAIRSLLYRHWNIGAKTRKRKSGC